MDQGCCNDTNWTETCDPFKRICYQYGMLLGVDEFQQDQGYHRSKHRMNQRLFIGYGLVYGGDFSVVKRTRTTGGANVDYLAVVVHGLLGLDDLGRELWLKEPCSLDLSTWWAQNKTTASVPTQAEDCAEQPVVKTIYVTVGFKQCCSNPVPAVAPPCDDQASPTMASRIQEIVECQLSFKPPVPPTDLGVARPADVRWSDDALKTFAGWVKAMCADEVRPLLLGTMEVYETGAGTLHVKKCRNHALPRIAMKVPPAFQVVSVHPNLYCREPTLDVRFSLPPLVASIDGFHVLELRPPGHHHKGPPKGGPGKGGHHGHHGHHPHGACEVDGCEKSGHHSHHAHGAYQVESCDDEPEVVSRGLSGVRELVDHKAMARTDECDPTLLRIPLCEPPMPGNPFRIVISGTGMSAVLSKGMVALNDGADFTLVFENKEKPETGGK